MNESTSFIQELTQRGWLLALTWRRIKWSCCAILGFACSSSRFLWRVNQSSLAFTEARFNLSIKMKTSLYLAMLCELTTSSRGAVTGSRRCRRSNGSCVEEPREASLSPAAILCIVSSCISLSEVGSGPSTKVLRPSITWFRCQFSM